MTIIEQTTAITTRHNERHTQNDLNLTFARFNSAKNQLDDVVKTLQNLSDQFNVIKKIVTREKFIELETTVQGKRDELIGILNTHLGAIDNIQAHNIKSSFESFSNPIENSITLHWELYKQALNLPLISEDDVKAYKDIINTADFNSLADQIIEQQKSTEAKITDCPSNNTEYEKIQNQIDQIKSGISKLYSFLPEHIRIFLQKMDSEQGANIDDLTEDIIKWFREKGRISKLCIKPRPQNG